MSIHNPKSMAPIFFVPPTYWEMNCARVVAVRERELVKRRVLMGARPVRAETRLGKMAALSGDWPPLRPECLGSARGLDSAAFQAPFPDQTV